jgi:hypothetical protein
MIAWYWLVVEFIVLAGLASIVARDIGAATLGILVTAWGFAGIIVASTVWIGFLSTLVFMGFFGLVLVWIGFRLGKVRL